MSVSSYMIEYVAVDLDRDGFDLMLLGFGLKFLLIMLLVLLLLLRKLLELLVLRV